MKPVFHTVCVNTTEMCLCQVLFKMLDFLQYETCLSLFVWQVNDTVLTEVQGGGQLAAASDISPPYPSQRSISLPAGTAHTGQSGSESELERRVIVFTHRHEGENKAVITGLHERICDSPGGELLTPRF